MKAVSTLSKYGTLEYSFDRLPSKLKPWYKYASDFVRVTKQKTARIIYANNLLKCYYMENDPANTCEVEFILPSLEQPPYHRTKIIQKEVKFLYTKGSEEVELIFKDASFPAGIILRTLTNLSQNNLIKRFAFNLTQDFDSLEPEMQFYTQEAMKAVKICEERNIKIYSKLVSRTGEAFEMDFPIIMDERTTAAQTGSFLSRKK